MMNPPNLPKQLLKAVAAGQVNQLEQLLAHGQGPSAWEILLATPLKQERGFGLPKQDPAQVHELRRHTHGTVVWAVTNQALLAKRLPLYRLLDQHDIPLAKDQAMALSWRDGDDPGLRAYWHQRGIHLRDHRDRLIEMLCTWRPPSYLPSQGEVAFTGVPLNRALPRWRLEDPELFATPTQRGQMARILSHRHAYVDRIANILEAWEGQSLDLQAQSEPTALSVGGHTFEVPAGSVLTDLVDTYARFLDGRVVRWSEPDSKGPGVHFWKGLACFEATCQHLIARGADPQARNAQGLTIGEVLDRGPGGEFLRARARHQQLQDHPIPVTPLSRASARRRI